MSPERARPRAQQRCQPSRHRIIQRASPSVPCCGRGRPRSAVNFVGVEVTRLILFRLVRDSSRRLLRFWHGVRPNGTNGNDPGARPSPGAATLPTKPPSEHPSRIAVRSLLRPGTATLRLLFAVAADVSPLHPNTARKIMSRFTSAATN